MNASPSKSESAFLERVRVALSNAGTHPEIKSKLAPFGMDEPKLAVGWSLYEKVLSTHEKNKVKTGELKLASNAYKMAYADMESLFKKHRDIAREFFKKRPEFIITLDLKGRFPSRYADFFDKSKAFYTAIQNHPEIQEQLSLCQITPEVVTDSLAKHQNLLTVRATYDKEFGESQQSTQSKNDEMNELKTWMDEFDTLAKVALYDNPQLLEVLGIFVRS
jgi:hypothetical protein